MTTELAATLPVPGGLYAPVEIRRRVPHDVQTCYDGTSAVFRLLRLETWGPVLMNLGYFEFRGLLSPINLVLNLELAQRRLVMKAVEMLGIDRRHHLLDVACGRGKSSFVAHCMNPDAVVTGVDLLECNIQVAKTCFNQVQNLSYVAGNAMDLDFPDQSVDRVMCLEAAFHFPDRSRFLQEAYRVLKPGGRLIVVDFAWITDQDRVHRDAPETRAVREVWHWTDLYSIPEYERVAGEAGFKMSRKEDWSRRVTHPIQGLFRAVSGLGNSVWGRRFLTWRNPLYRSFSDADWKEVARAVKSHDYVMRYSRYMAFVFEKPAAAT